MAEEKVTPSPEPEKAPEAPAENAAQPTDNEAKPVEGVAAAASSIAASSAEAAIEDFPAPLSKKEKMKQKIRASLSFLWPALSAPADADEATRKMGWAFYISWILVIGMGGGVLYWALLYKPPLSPEAQFEMEAKARLEEPMEVEEENPLKERPDHLAEVGRYFLVVTPPVERGPNAHQLQELQVAPHAKHFQRVAFELALECDSSGTCDKISGLRHQVRDLVVGVLDRSPAEDWLTREGKSRLKDHLQLRLNQWLVTGKVRQVYFLNVTLEPK